MNNDNNNNNNDNDKDNDNDIVIMQEPITRSLQLPHIPVSTFSQTDLFLV